MQLAKSDDVERVSKMASPISKRFISNFQVRRGCATFPSAARGRTATDDGPAARIHRGTLVGELAACTSLRGDVEVAHPATFPVFFACASPPPRVLNIFSPDCDLQLGPRPWDARGPEHCHSGRSHFGTSCFAPLT